MRDFFTKFSLRIFSSRILTTMVFVIDMAIIYGFLGPYLIFSNSNTMAVIGFLMVVVLGPYTMRTFFRLWRMQPHIKTLYDVAYKSRWE